MSGLIKSIGNKRKLLTIVILFALALLIIGSVYYWFAHRTQEMSEGSTQLTSDDQHAQAQLKKEIDKEADKEKKSELMYEYGDYYINSSQYDKAVENGLAIEKLNPTAQSAGLLGDIYVMKSDYKNAVKYYEIAMSRSKKPKNERVNSPYNDYRIKKVEAEAKL